jgi:hypothetical protein
VPAAEAAAAAKFIHIHSATVSGIMLLVTVCVNIVQYTVKWHVNHHLIIFLMKHGFICMDILPHKVIST